MKKVCIVTAIRSEYGLLRNLIKKLSIDQGIDFRLAVTGAHLLPEFGNTYREIEQDGINIDKKIEIPIDVSNEIGISIAMAEALKKFTEYFKEEEFDLVILLGDRYETLSIASAAMLTKTPIAHMHGGELTLGAIDDAIRHSITKMSQIHFTSTNEYKERVIQLGENPERVFNVGAIGVENIRNLVLRNKEELESKLNINLDNKYAILIYHPVTLENYCLQNQISELLNAIDESIIENDLNYIIIGSNADQGGLEINSIFQNLSEKHSKNISFFKSLELIDFLSLLKNAEFMIGNSSSGILEAPSFGIPTINIGSRQKGRIAANSVLNIDLNKDEIKRNIEKSLYDEDFRNKVKDVKNPYEKEATSDNIIKIIKEFLNSNIDLQKDFYDINRNQEME